MITSQKTQSAWFKRTRAYTRDCAAENGKILRHLTTEDSARDMESLRRALDEPAINFYGFSYGTYLGQVYASLFPKRVRRLVFDSNVDFRDVWYRAALAQNSGVDRNINRWFDWLARNNATYGLGTTGAEVRRLFYDTQSRLYRSPATGSLGELGGSEWTDAFVFAAYSQLLWPVFGYVFSAYVRDGDAAPLEAVYVGFNGYGDDNGYAVSLGVGCTDNNWPERWARWKRDTRRSYRNAPFFAWANAWYYEPCRHWPAPAQDPVRIRDRGLDGMLLVSETLDAATPYSGSLAVRRRFDEARLVAVAGGIDHAGSLGGNACVDNRIAGYLLTGALPERLSGNRADVSCAPQPPPEPFATRQLRKSNQTLIREELQKRMLQR